MLNGLQNLRAVAAYAVVAFHIVEQLIFGFGLPLPRFTLGEAGVDLFFVLSGFVMVHVTGASETPGEFLGKRVGRIVPLYWVATTLAIALVLIMPTALQRADLSLASVIASYAFIPYPDGAGILQPILFVGWTLNYEMSFYVLFAAALVFPQRWRVLAVMGLIAFLLVAARTAPIGTLSDFYGQFIILEFAAGCAIAWALRQPAVSAVVARTPIWPLMVLSGFAFIGAAMMEPTFESRAFWYGLPAIAMVFAVAGQDLHRKPVRSSILGTLGDASYSAYVLHPLILAVLGAVILKVTGQSWLGGAMFALSSLAATMIAAAISLRLLERPANRAVRGALATARTRQAVQDGQRRKSDQASGQSR